MFIFFPGMNNLLLDSFFFIAMLIKSNYKFYNEYMYCYRYKQVNNFVQCFYRMCHPCPRWTSSRPFLPPSYRRVSPRCPSSRGVPVSSSQGSRSISWSRLREEQPASPKDGSLSSLCYIWLVQILFSILLLSDVIIMLFCWSYNDTLCLVVII